MFDIMPNAEVFGKECSAGSVSGVDTATSWDESRNPRADAGRGSTWGGDVEGRAAPYGVVDHGRAGGTAGTPRAEGGLGDRFCKTKRQFRTLGYVWESYSYQIQIAHLYMSASQGRTVA